MFATAFVAMTLLTSGYALGHTCTRSRCQRLRTDLATARHLAEHDPLTGLLNRAGAQQFYETQTASGAALAAVLIDLDGFKTVNDTWGHQVGDAQLVAVAHRLTEASLVIDAVACRLAGDEFLLLVPNPDANLIQAQVAGILAHLCRPLTLVAVDAVLIGLTPGASAGIAVPQADKSWASMLHRADIALYQAKALGGQAVVYTSGMQQPPLESLLGARLRDSAIANYA